MHFNICILKFYERFLCNKRNSAPRDLKTIHLVQISHYVNETQMCEMFCPRLQSKAGT